jgi:DDE superfamily endonuclease
VLLFGDESEALTHPYLAHAWAKKKGTDLRVPAPGQSAKVTMLGAFDWARRELVVSTSDTKRSADFMALLEGIDERYGPKIRRCDEADHPCLDNGPIDTSKATRAALERKALAHNRVAPEIPPELNDIEEVRRDLKRHHGNPPIQPKSERL